MIRGATDTVARTHRVVFSVTGLGIAALLMPHLSDPLWQDELKTLELFSSQGFLHPFRVYPFPNNHVLFSSLLSLFTELLGNSDSWALRLLPAACFGGSLVLLAAAVAGMGGARAALLGVLLFGTSHVSLAFATELRGYAVSWLPLCVAWWGLPRWLASGGALRGGVYLLAVGASVAILPTNLWIASVLGVYALLSAWLERDALGARGLGRATFAALAPLSGGLAYVAIWSDVLRTAGTDWNDWGLASLSGHWFWATTTDFVWLLPGVVLGIWGLLRGSAGEGPAALASRRILLFTGSCTVVPLLGFGLLPQVPYPRNLVPLLPLWYGALALILAAAWEALPAAWRRFDTALQWSLCLVLLGTAGLRESRGADFVDRHPEPVNGLVQDLYDQYYHHAFEPSAAAASIAGLAAEGPLLIVTDYNGVWVVGAEVEHRYGGELGRRLVHFRDTGSWPSDIQAVGRLFVMTNGIERAREIARMRGLREPGPGDRVATSGFFEIYRTRLDPSAGATP
ncbi:hypothetical protein MK489_11095 [Myxococcota bacterium]|nr:hypothetical protein [Myxococcota bacterium]